MTWINKTGALPGSRSFSRACTMHCGYVDQAVADAREWTAQRPDNNALQQAGCCAPAQAPADGRAAG